MFNATFTEQSEFATSNRENSMHCATYWAETSSVTANIKQDPAQSAFFYETTSN